MRLYRNAFTLIELLAVMTLMAIAATIIAPRLGDSQDWVRVPSAARQVLGDMLYLQNYAITTQQTVWVYLITDSNGNIGYTAATFANTATPASPTYSQAIAANAGGFAGVFVPRATGMPAGQPAVVSRLITQFGPGAPASRSAGALPQTLLSSVVLDTGSGTAITSFGFDHMGQPVTASGAVIDNIKITVTSTSGTSPTCLYIHPVSGEITTNAP